MPDKVACVKCGKSYTMINQIIDIHSVGLALAGTCSECGGRVWCGELWKRSKGKQTCQMSFLPQK